MKIRKNGVWEDYKYPIYESATDTITSLPTDIIADGQPVAAWTISGNMQQNSVPTPENPIQPQETGERTGNLFDKNAATLNERILSTSVMSDITYAHSDYIDVTGVSQLTVTSKYTSTNFYFYNDKTNISIGYYNGLTADVPEGAKYVRVNLPQSDINTFMLVEGSTAPSSYEPHGYKIPISSANTTTPVYLGEVETTRKIRKYEFTGEENGTIYDTSTSRKGIEFTGITGIIGGNADIAILAICTHYQAYTRNTLYRNTDNGISNAYQNDKIIFYDASCQTVEAFRQFCAQQYAAGTPVTVWYVLATPTTGIVNEPLRKIGDYADTISNVAEIPTTAGEQTFDVDTSLKPSSVEITYKGWHKHTPKEYNNGSWS